MNKLVFVDNTINNFNMGFLKPFLIKILSSSISMPSNLIEKLNYTILNHKQNAKIENYLNFTDQNSFNVNFYVYPIKIQFFFNQILHFDPILWNPFYLIKSNDINFIKNFIFPFSILNVLMCGI